MNFGTAYLRAFAACDGAICSKNRKIVPYHGANPNTRNGECLRSPSLIMAPGVAQCHEDFRVSRQVTVDSSGPSEVVNGT